MTTFNCAAFIQAAIASIKAQTLTAWELIIVDDGSDDETWEILKGERDNRIRIWRISRQGRPRALNFALAQARSGLVAIQDADDLSVPERLQIAVQHLEQRPDLAGVMSGHWLLIEERLLAPRAEAKSAERCHSDIQALQLPALDPTLVVRTEVARRLGYDEALKIASPMDFIFRLSTTSRIAVIGLSLYIYRVRPNSVTLQSVPSREHFVRRVFDLARSRSGLQPFTDDEYSAVRQGVDVDPLNDTVAHFIDSAFLQVTSRNRRGAVGTALDALRYLPFRMKSLAPLAYATSPLWLSRLVRRSRHQARLQRAAAASTPTTAHQFEREA